MLDIFTDPSFAGLHWAIPRDTPAEDRARAHLNAACAARAVREKEANRPRSIAYAPATDSHLLLWPNGSLTLMSTLEIAAIPLRVAPVPQTED